ncbi:MAG TPA: FAD-dependent oxidoreductase, partial [Anaerolineae bacterium]
MYFYDVIVIGGGVMGAATAEFLASQRRKKVLLLEQFEPGHERGSSHGDGRIIRIAYPEAVYLEMVRQVYPLWQEVEARSGETLMQITGNWECGPARCQPLADLEASFQAHGVHYERLAAAESNRRFPQLYLEAGSEAIYHADGGVLFATRAVEVLWRLAREAGVTTATGERVTGIEVSSGQLAVSSEQKAEGGKRRTWRGGRLVVTAGAWAGSLLAQLDLDLPLAVRQEQVAYFRPKERAGDHQVGVMPTCIDYHADPPFYCLPQISLSGPQAGVKAGWHHTGAAIDPDEPQPYDQENLAAVQDFLRRRLPHLDTTPSSLARCLYTNTPDYHFILDRHPSWPQVVIG